MKIESREAKTTSKLNIMRIGEKKVEKRKSGKVKKRKSEKAKKKRLFLKRKLFRLFTLSLFRF
jgi:hypothetical protein